MGSQYFVHLRLNPLSLIKYVVGQLSLRTRHRVLAVAALDKSLSMVLMTLTYVVGQ